MASIRRAASRIVSGALALALLAACGGSDPPAEGDGSERDAGAGDAAGPRPTILIGTGLDRFEPLEPGAELGLEAGPQGGGRFSGHHILCALRLVGLAPAELSLVEVRILDEAGQTQASLQRDPARSPFVGGRDLPNLAPRLEDCCAVAGRPVVIEAVATGRDGQVHVGTLTGTASACPRPETGPSVCL